MTGLGRVLSDAESIMSDDTEAFQKARSTELGEASQKIIGRQVDRAWRGRLEEA